MIRLFDFAVMDMEEGLALRLKLPSTLALGGEDRGLTAKIARNVVKLASKWGGLESHHSGIESNYGII